VFAAGLDADLRYVLVAFQVEAKDLDKLNIADDSVLVPGDEVGVN
jgi:hypothetical protein